MIYQTTKCSLHNHPEFQLSCDNPTIPEQDINWLVNHLETEVANGVVFLNDEFIQIGCMLTKVVATNQYYQLFEPDMIAMPVNFTNSIANTLKHFRQQKDICESITISESIDYPSLRESIIVSDSFESSTAYYFNREAREDHQSGWFFRDINQSDEQSFTQISLYEFACSRPDLIKFLALPVGYSVLKREQDIFRVIANESEITPHHDSFLAAINAALSQATL